MLKSLGVCDRAKRIGLSILKLHCLGQVCGQVCGDSVAGAFSDVACICTLIYTGLAVNWRHILHAKFLPHRAKEKKNWKLEPVVELEKNPSRVQARQFRLRHLEPPPFAPFNLFQALGYSDDQFAERLSKWLPKS